MQFLRPIIDFRYVRGGDRDPFYSRDRRCHRFIASLALLGRERRRREQFLEGSAEIGAAFVNDIGQVSLASAGRQKSLENFPRRGRQQAHDVAERMPLERLERAAEVQREIEDGQRMPNLRELEERRQSAQHVPSPIEPVEDRVVLLVDRPHRLGDPGQCFESLRVERGEGQPILGWVRERDSAAILGPGVEQADVVGPHDSDLRWGSN